jgi:DNA polymerase III sliding clamp (beta) subunit (PCNA family)
MQVIKKELVKAIRSLKKAIRSKGEADVRLGTDKMGYLELAVSSQDIFGQDMCVFCLITPRQVSGEVSCCVDINTLAKVVDAVKSDKIDISIVDKQLRISGDLSIDIETADSKEFHFPVYEWTNICEFKSEDLLLVSPAMSTDVTRQHLARTRVAKHIIAATDGHRLYFVGNHRDENSVCIPDSAVSVLLSNGCGVVSAYSGVRVKETRKTKDGKEVIDYEYAVRCITDNGMVVFSKISDEAFPPFEKIIPSDNEQLVVLDTDKLKNTLSAIAKVNNPEDTVIMEYIDKSVKLSCGKIKVDIVASKITGDDLKRYGFKCRYLLEALGDAKKTKIETKSPLNPIMVTCGKLKAVIMPVRI